MLVVATTGTITTKCKVKAKTEKSASGFSGAAGGHAVAAVGKKKSKIKVADVIDDAQKSDESKDAPIIDNVEEECTEDINEVKMNNNENKVADCIDGTQIIDGESKVEESIKATVGKKSKLKVADGIDNAQKSDKSKVEEEAPMIDNAEEEFNKEGNELTMNNNEKVAKCIDDTKILDGESKVEASIKVKNEK